MLKRFLVRTTFRKKLFYYSLLISIVPVLILGSVSSWVSSRAVQNEVNNNHHNILKLIQSNVDQILRSLDKASLQLSSNLAVVKSVEAGPSVQHLNDTLDMMSTLRLQKGLSDIDFEISLVFNHFDKVYSTRYSFTNLADFPYRDVIKLTPIRYNSTVFVSPGHFQNQKEFLLLRPIPVMFDNTPDGVMILHLDAAHFSRLLGDVELSNDRRLVILDGDGMIIAGLEDKSIGERLATAAQLQELRNRPEESLSQLTINKETYHLSILKSASNDWTYVAMVPMWQLTQQANFIRMTTWAIVCCIVLIWLFVSFAGSNRMYNPVFRLAGNLSDGKEQDGLETIRDFIQKTVVANEQLRSKLSEQLPYVKENFALKLMKGELSHSDMAHLAKEHHIELRGSLVALLLVDMDGFHLFQKQYSEKDRSLLGYAFRKMVEEIVEEKHAIVVVAGTLSQVAVAVEASGGQQGDVETTLREAAEEILAKIREYFTFTATVAIGLKCRGLTGISQSYRDASELLGYRLLLGGNRLITREDIRSSLQHSNMSLVGWQKQMVTHLAHGQLDAAEATLREMVESLPRVIQTSETALGLFAYLIGELELLITDSEGEKLELWEGDLYKQLYGMDTLGAITDWLIGVVFPAVVTHMQGMDRQKRLVQQTLIYIKDHLLSDLSLQQVADDLQVPHFQLSRAFKDYTGTTFSDYVIQLRMDKAKEWLAQTDMELKEMAEKLSYATVQNFSRIFKQIVGVPPGQYRKQNRTGL